MTPIKISITLFFSTHTLSGTGRYCRRHQAPQRNLWRLADQPYSQIVNLTLNSCLGKVVKCSAATKKNRSGITVGMDHKSVSKFYQFQELWNY